MSELEVKVTNLTDAINNLIVRLDEPKVAVDSRKKPVTTTTTTTTTQSDRMYLILILLVVGLLVYFFKNYKIGIDKK